MRSKNPLPTTLKDVYGNDVHVGDLVVIGIGIHEVIGFSPKMIRVLPKKNACRWASPYPWLARTEDVIKVDFIEKVNNQHKQDRKDAENDE